MDMPRCQVMLAFVITHIYGYASVSDDACVTGKTRIFGHAQVLENARVYGEASVCGSVIVNENMEISGSGKIETLDQIYYYGGVTIFFDRYDELIANGTTADIEHHKTLARLKLA